ncbi:hypothetical protein AXK11_05065 [Cephaloticoccus primus]|uniref:ABC-type transport auxiliary lipoprotein component domain-containing protein n=1 Tax=Cephaloticoccus primus TaxID=1548207 RepID=A0A139SN27_9BACT|nr:LPS assembly lipoprotein LptE [Cephaloticoccus primus]KXU35902.1 hypothetical protein AXK11_05065 [Cephaloticoccus primus]
MRRRLRFPLPALALAVGLALLGSGCMGYRLGTGAEAPLAFSTLHVAPVKMRALVPQAEAVITGAVREAFANDGRVALAAHPATAGAVLEITVRSYRRETATADPEDTGLARKLSVVLLAELTLRAGEGAETPAKTYFRARPIEVRRDIFIDSGQQQAEYQALPLLAQDLADKALHAVLDTW